MVSSSVIIILDELLVKWEFTYLSILTNDSSLVF